MNTRPMKPASLERAEGYPGKGGLRNRSKAQIDAQIEAEASIPPIGAPFTDMAPRAQKKWKILGHEWAVVLKETDREFLRLYCEMWVDLMDTQVMLSALGPICNTRDGYKMSPYAVRAGSLRAEMMRMLVQVGGTPAARQKVEISKPSEGQSKIESLMN